MAGAPLTVSVGLAVLGEDGQNAAELSTPPSSRGSPPRRAGSGSSLTSQRTATGSRMTATGSRRSRTGRAWPAERLGGRYCADGVPPPPVPVVVPVVPVVVPEPEVADGIAAAPTVAVPCIPSTRAVAIVRSQLAWWA